MDLSKEIQSFIQGLINARGELLRQHLGNTSDQIVIQHEKLKKAFDYAKSIKTTQAGWVAFLQKWEATCRYILIANRGLAKMENRLMLIIIEIKKI